MNFLATIICILIMRCCGIEEDYYIDNIDLNNQGNKYSNSSLSRRINDYDDKRYPSPSGSSTNFNLENIFYYDKKEYNPKDLEKSDIIVARKQISDSKNYTVTPFSKIPYTQLSISDLLEDYDYNIDDRFNKPRSDSEDLFKPNPQRSRNENNANETKTFAMFYNLEPAVKQNIYKINLTDYRHRTWYVMHDLPCWDLPLLYGEVSYQNKKSVFTLYGWKVIHVDDPGWHDQSQYKSPGLPLASQNLNKWCEVEPCYGDHTLCAFNEKKISKICKIGYRVHVPTIVDQMTITNTINSMRNRIANGLSKKYAHLPSAANMQQVIYDYDLEKMSQVWLRQCLPGPAPCSALDNSLVSELECVKHAKYCCKASLGKNSKCVPKAECFLFAVTGCIHVWYSRAGQYLAKTDIECGRASVKTFDTVQLFWAKTTKVGCAYGENVNGDIRVICNFAPGAPFFLDTKLYCGIISFDKLRQFDKQKLHITEKKFMSVLKRKWDRFLTTKKIAYKATTQATLSSRQSFARNSGREIDILKKIYGVGWARNHSNSWENGTRSSIARLVAKYQFIDKSEARCDTEETVYVIGKPGSLCVENGRTFQGLCYDFRDPTPGYRLIAVLAPIILFSLILYDLFSGVVRQTNY